MRNAGCFAGSTVRCIAAVLLLLALTFGSWIDSAAAPAPGEGETCVHRSITIALGETLRLPVGDTDGLCWFCDGAAVILGREGEITAVQPGVSILTAQGRQETVIFTLRVTEQTVQAPGRPTQERTPAEGIWSEETGWTRFCVAVNRLMDCVTVFEKDEDGRYTVPVRSMICSTGEDTPLGVYETGDRVEWLSLFGDVYGQYATVIVGNILFHSVPYSEPRKDALRWDYYNLLGTGCSMGCVRLQVADAQWIYENCEYGTPVIIYEDEDPGPLGKPEAPQLEPGCMWDPTDPDPANPWNAGRPVLHVPYLRTAEPYTRPDLLEGVTALDPAGGDAVSMVRVSGEVDTGRNGLYLVTYSLTDLLGHTVRAEGWIRVTGA